MAINKSLWKPKVIVFPRWPCITCQSGHFTSRPNDTRKEQTGPSLRAQRDPDMPWEPDWICQRFSTFLKCSNSSCEEIAVITGTSELEEYHIPLDPDPEFHEEGPHYRDLFTILFAEPALIPIQLPSDLSNDIVELITESAQLYWMNPEACANKLRQAIEALLTQQKIKRYVIRRRKRCALTLHARLDLYRVRKPDIADLLLAVKWIGNAGSHVGDISHDDALEGFEILEQAFSKLFDPSTERVAARAKAINKRKGPVKRKAKAKSRRR